MSEEELIKACIGNDRKAQRELYDQFSGQMMAVCLRYAGNGADAADMMQDGFIRVFEKLEQYKGDGALGGWIRRVVVNSALLHLRKEKKHSFNEEINDDVMATASTFDVFAKLAAEDIMQLIQQLPTGYRTVFNLFAIEGYSHKEIAQQLGISESTSKTQFHKAKIQLRNELEAIEQRDERR
ncbi:MAG: sigma-70 family RNA polymerase sigma factor [Flavobacteriales bacterium]|nr:sigma-70 family RNA polymerase sigma factor [Flavobacteriales bacterium]MDG1779443.1 sigma-70 family RNA polymerase sigma factor [Flavobacteriales bacterium]MDG2245011.1 sigma-70 family RNA polymerase sigma factor [Flavobacteriales bacterium]